MKETIIKYVLARLGEPSTWRGVVTAVTSLGVFTLSGAQADAAIGLGLALHGLLSVVLPDSFSNKKE